MSTQELRDELMTLLVAGHETTASELAWAFERLAREPAVLARLLDEVDAGNGDDYLTATINETLRRRPVLPNAAPRLTKQPVRSAAGAIRRASAGAKRVPRPPRPDDLSRSVRVPPRALPRTTPGTYTWIPFGGGRRRCLGASFALLEMKIVLRAVLARTEVGVAGELERSRRRSITISPSAAARTVLRGRRGVPRRPEPVARAA